MHAHVTSDQFDDVINLGLWVIASLAEHKFPPPLRAAPHHGGRFSGGRAGGNGHGIILGMRIQDTHCPLHVQQGLNGKSR